MRLQNLHDDVDDLRLHHPGWLRARRRRRRQSRAAVRATQGATAMAVYTWRVSINSIKISVLAARTNRGYTAYGSAQTSKLNQQLMTVNNISIDERL